MIEGVLVEGYTMDFPSIDLELKHTDPKMYDAAILVCYIEELKKGFKVSRIYKTTKKGTSIKYIAIKSKEEALSYSDKIQFMVDEHCEKYGGF